MRVQQRTIRPTSAKERAAFIDFVKWKGEPMKHSFLFAAAIATAIGFSGSAHAANGDAKVDTSQPNAPVAYPAAAQRNNEQGTVRMLVKVSDFGQPMRIRVVK